MLSGPLDIEYERMTCRLVVKDIVLMVTGATSIETCQTYVQTSWIVNGIEALGTILSVYRLARSWWVKIWFGQQSTSLGFDGTYLEIEHGGMPCLL